MNTSHTDDRSAVLRTLDELGGDLRYAARSLRRWPGFTLAAVLILSVGIGVTGALVGVIDQLFFRPLPLHQPERLVEIETRLNAQVTLGFVQERHLDALRTGAQQVDGLAGAKSLAVLAGGAATSRHTPALFVTDNYFDVLGAVPALGRAFAADDFTGSGGVVLLSHGFWHRAHGGAADVLGSTVLVNGQPFTVVGVMPKRFATQRAGSPHPELWLPLPALGIVRPGHNSPTMHAIARLSPGTSLQQAQAELSTLLRAAEAGRTGITFEGVDLYPLDAVARRDRAQVVSGVRLLGIAALLLLLLTAVNVGGMLLARAMARRHEIGVRLALGASRSRVVRQLLTEGGVLFLLGGILALFVSRWLTTALASVPWPVTVHLEQGGRVPVLAVGLALALLLGMAASLLPALHATRRNYVSPASHDQLRAPRTRVRAGAVVLQLALSLVLLVGAALFLRGLLHAWSIDLGFRADRVAVAPLDPAGGGVAGATVEADPLLEAVRSVPGVEAAALTTDVPSYAAATTIRLSPTAGSLELPFPIETRTVSPDFFRALGIATLSGRDFGAGDHRGAERVTVVSRSLAARLWPGENAVGSMLGSGSSGLRVVGVVGDVRVGSLQAEPLPVVYLPLAQEPASALNLVVLTSGDAAVLAAVRERARSAAPAVGDLQFERLSQRIAEVLTPQRMGAALLGGFALFGLLLAALGLYGMLAYAVTTRIHELGVRMALGAARADILRQVLGRGLAMAAAGTLIGLATAAATSRFLAGLLYGVSALDPLAYAGAAAALLVIAAAASLVPALRAARVDPMHALRAD